MRTRFHSRCLASLAVVSFATFFATSVRAEDTDVKPVVTAPKDPGDAPKLTKPTDGSSATVSAGALMQTGNSYMLAGTANGAYERRFGSNSVGVAGIGNYGESRPPGGKNAPSTENAQGKLRYDRFLTDDLTGFMMLTGRSDRFEGIEFRLNVDPGVKYLFLNQNTTALWGEAGYDFQYDVRRDDARGSLSKTDSDHAARLFAGFKYAFNTDVTAKAGIEYLQSVLESDQYRVNFDALVAAKLKGGLAMGVGFSARYDHHPLPGKEELDTSTSLNLIYSFADPSPKKDNCPCPEPPPEGAAPGGSAPPSGSPPPPPPADAAPPTAPPPPPAPAPSGSGGAP